MPKKKQDDLDQLQRGARQIHRVLNEENVPFSYPQTQRGLALGRIPAEKYGDVFISTRRRLRGFAQALRGETV
ncbi:MAG: hypothetical protein R3322_08885 [Kiloniellales bacterium]|nr:hypothetical protein [Kiloniellales bacterium]